MTPEGRVKEEIKSVLHEFGCIKAGAAKNKYPNPVRGWYYMPVQNGMGVVGIPDFIVCLEGGFVAVEAKAERGVLSANQEARLGEIAAGLGRTIVCTSGAQLREFLTNL